MVHTSGPQSPSWERAMAAGHLRRRGGVFWFRRRVPEQLVGRLERREVQRSLGTSSPREAAARAMSAWLATETVFTAMTRLPSLKQRQALLILEQLLTEPLHASPTADELVDAVVRGEGVLTRQFFNREVVDLVMARPPHEQFHIAGHMRGITDRLEVAVARQSEENQGLKANLREQERDRAISALEEVWGELAKVEVARDVSDRLAELAANAPPTPAPAPAPAAPEEPEPDLGQEPEPERKAVRGKKRPLWSAVVKSFLAEKSRVVAGHREYDQQTIRQTESTMALWTDLVGDRTLDTYDGSDAGVFRDLMLRMPSSHGKSGTRAAVRKKTPPLEAIRRADELQKGVDARNALRPEGVPREVGAKRLTMKTLKRHFSTLSQFWIHAGRHGHVAAEPNPFRSWQYQGVSRGGANKKRGPWSDQDIATLYGSAWFSEAAIGTENWWVTLICQWQGLRVEEVFRLRTSKDIQTIGGVLAIVVQDHPEPDKWSPKSEAGERIVPVHSVLLGLGFAALVETRKKEGAYRLFASGRRPSSNKLSAKFVSDFSRMKTALGVGPETTLHSWRHNISTILRNTKSSEARESWIDAVLGHSGSDDADGKARPRSEGITTYLGGIAVENLRLTVEAIQYPAADLTQLRKLRAE